MHSTARAILFTSLLATAVVESSAQDHWRQVPSPTTHRLWNVHFVDSLTGWAAGDFGALLRTTDGGESWSVLNPNTTATILDVFFLTPSLGWAMIWRLEQPPYGSNILRSTNGGEAWTIYEYPEEDVFFQKILFLDSLNGWMVGNNGTIARTTNGGTTWTHAWVDSSQCSRYPMVDMLVQTPQTSFVCGGRMDLSGVMWRSTNGGAEWSATCVSPEPIQEMHSIDSLNLIAVGGDMEFGSSIIRTTDGGETWRYSFLQYFGMAMAISFRTPAEGWVALGFTQTFIYTLDTGRTWTEVPTPNGAVIYDLVFTDSLHGYAVGDDGVILKYVPQPADVNDSLTTAASSYSLSPNFPNPFNPATQINYSIPTREFVSIKVFDLLGREVGVLVSEEKPAGEYSTEFDATGVPSGVYLCRMQAGALTLTRKIVLIR
jgi:photosystem II stability/assembly factor-like uncharacterized protein